MTLKNSFSTRNISSYISQILNLSTPPHWQSVKKTQSAPFYASNKLQKRQLFFSQTVLTSVIKIFIPYWLCFFRKANHLSLYRLKLNGEANLSQLRDQQSTKELSHVHHFSCSPSYLIPCDKLLVFRPGRYFSNGSASG